MLDSAAVVVGSMVIAPLIGPAMATSTGTVLQDGDLFRRGVKFQVLGFVLAIVTAAAFAWLLKSAQLVPLTNPEVLAISQVRERLAPDFLSLAVALGAGVAGAYSLSSGISTSLVGVAIAVALVPPTAVIGIGLAWGLPAVVAGATVLVLVNFLSINLAALAVLWYQGYRPERWFREDAARSATIKRVAVLAVAILLLSTFLGAVTYTTLQTAQLEETVRSDVREVLDRPAYAELSLVSVRVETREGTLFESPETVVVTVSHPPGETYPGLADRIAQHMDEDELTVEVQYVAVQRTSA
ncbi:MAG: TIGR00341 family protein [Halobacteriales archaeon]